MSEHLGHSRRVFTIETYQHVLPGMQARVASTFEQLISPGAPPGTRSTGWNRRNTRMEAA